MTGCEDGSTWQVLIVGVSIMGALFLGVALLIWVADR